MIQLLILLKLSAGWIQFLQFFIALSILILLHEWGHYYAARRTGTRVEKFYLFFDFFFPVSTWLPFSLWKKKIGDTVFGIGWFPLGGYVKIAGMVDESMDTEAMALPPKPDEFRSKTAPQRLLIMLGGIIMNLVLAFIVYTIIYFSYGETYLKPQNLKYGIACDSLAMKAGLQDGDKILAINGKKLERFEDAAPEFFTNSDKPITIERNGVTQDIVLQKGTLSEVIRKKQRLFSERIPFVILEKDTELNFKNNGFLKGDKVVSFNGLPITYYQDFTRYVESIKHQQVDPPTGFKKWMHSIFKANKPYDSIMVSDTNMAYEMAVLRGDSTMKMNVNLTSKGKLGIAMYKPDSFLAYENVKYNLFQAIGRGFKKTGSSLSDYVGQLGLMFKSSEVKVSDSLGGFGSFMKIFPEKFDMRNFLGLLAFISIILAFMNLLPIPGLDGGYVMFLLWEIITGKKVNEKVMEVATSIGLMLLLGLMLYANGLDAFRAWFK
jgi:regulator of sigma E protease